MTKRRATLATLEWLQLVVDGADVKSQMTRPGESGAARVAHVRSTHTVFVLLFLAVDVVDACVAAVR